MHNPNHLAKLQVNISLNNNWKKLNVATTSTTTTNQFLFISDKKAYTYDEKFL